MSCKQIQRKRYAKCAKQIKAVPHNIVVICRAEPLVHILPVGLCAFVCVDKPKVSFQIIAGIKPYGLKRYPQKDKTKVRLYMLAAAQKINIRADGYNNFHSSAADNGHKLIAHKYHTEQRVAQLVYADGKKVKHRAEYRLRFTCKRQIKKQCAARKESQSAYAVADK